MPEAGAVVGGKYEIVGVVGKGGMGVVFEATHKRLSQRVALKMLRPHVRDDPETIARFEREARAAGQLRSMNIARVLDVETQNAELPYIVMEFLEGRDLEDEIAEVGMLPVPEAVDYVLQACAGIHEAHELGIIHRDLKPANLFLCRTPDGPIIKILDFGISKIKTEQDSRLTAAMTTMGSPIYMSPEQLRDVKDVDQRADVWGLGIILFELLTGRTPFVGTVTSVTASIVADPAPTLSSLRDGIPPGLEAIVAKALEKKPEARFQDAETFGEALSMFASPEGSRRFHASLSMPVATPRSLRPVATPADAETRPSFSPGETRNAFTSASFANALRPRRTRWVAALAAVAAVVAVLVVVLTLAARRAETRAASAQPPAAESNPAAPPAVASAAPSAESSAATTPILIPAKTTATSRTFAPPPPQPPPKPTNKNPLHL
jgi:serine/threonine-protein kinase